MVADKAKRSRVRKLEVMVAEVEVETHDTVTLHMFGGNDAFDYRAGQFCSIDPRQFPALERWVRYLEQTKGRREPPRAYSMASAPHEKYLSITIKEEEYDPEWTPYPPVLSPFLVRHTPPGTRLVVKGFTGPYYLRDDIVDQTDRIVHICAGSGIVPNWGIIKAALHDDLPLKHTLIYGNKTWDEIIYRDALIELAAAHPERLEIVHAISREPDATRRGDNVAVGRVSRDLIAEHLGDPSRAIVYACGPALSKWDKQRARKTGEELKPRFMETVLAALDDLGVPKKQRHYETYG